MVGKGPRSLGGEGSSEGRVDWSILFTLLLSAKGYFKFCAFKWYL